MTLKMPKEAKKQMKKTIAITQGVVGMGIVDSISAGAGFTGPTAAVARGITPIMGMGVLGLAAGDTEGPTKAQLKKMMGY